MIAKIFKGVWFLSLLVTVVLFLYVYASLPEEVQLTVADQTSAISREIVFYSTLTLLALINASVLVLPRLNISRQAYFELWILGLAASLNLFIIVALEFVSLINSFEKYDYQRLGVIIYGTLTLFILWLLWWPAYSLFKGFFSKQSI